MTTPVDDLPSFVREALDGEAVRPDAVRNAREAVVALAAGLPASTPNPEARARLLTSIATGAERYAPFFDRLAQMVDLELARVRAVFDAAEDTNRWERDKMPGLALFHFEPGPALAGADAGLVEIAAGVEFPEHVHLGSERVFVLRGAYRDSSGRIVGPGDWHEMPAESSHSYRVLPDAPCLYAVVLEAGITIGGQRFG